MAWDKVNNEIVDVVRIEFLEQKKKDKIMTKNDKRRLIELKNNNEEIKKTKGY